ncbi:MAG: M20/M25/M40 family metallo-hydrolase [Trueperaceae bacterium]|nr:M20/M25/M40 family metallo-hydrolase [Trueperaceae bacterium]
MTRDASPPDASPDPGADPGAGPEADTTHARPQGGGDALPAALLEWYRARLAELVALPSVAADGRAIPETAAAVRDLLIGEGFDAELHATGGAPVVFAERRVPGAPTLLLYNHYDVQPEDPVDAWTSPPFELTERDGAWYGRGAADDKGEIVSRLAALRAYRERHGDLPFGVVMVIEGEEEIGSPNLAAYVAAHADALAADGCLWEFGGVDAAGTPVTYCGMKGVVTLDLRVRTAERDLHSSYGVVARGAAARLAAAVASLEDEDGRVAVPGFTDGVRPPTDAQRALVDRLPDEAAELADVFGIPAWQRGLAGAAWNHALYFEPTLNVNGVHAGYGGEGAKTVLPSEAFAKLDVRLVPDQDPEAVVAAIRAHLDARGFADVEIVRGPHAERAGRSDPTDPFVLDAVAALEDAYAVAPLVLPNSPGSGPIHPFVEGVGVPVVGIGCGYPGSRIHGPDEHVRIEDVRRGTLATLRLFERVAARAGVTPGRPTD